jgi:hypothetical protein
MPDRTGTHDSGIRIVYWHDWGAIAREDRAIDRRQIVDDIFSDKIMGGLALLLIPLLLLIDFARLPPDASAVLSLIDVAIWIFFILEYICRISVAEDRLRYVLSPWHLLDLFIITAPAAALAFEAGYGIARYLRIMRVAQVFQLVKVGGKKVQKRITSRPLPVGDIVSGTPLILRSLPLTILPGSVQSDLPGWAEIPLSDQTLPGILKGEWRDFSGWTSADLEILSRFSGLPSYLLEEKLWERSYPRGEITGSSVMIFLRIPRLAQRKSPLSSMAVDFADIDRDGDLDFYVVDMVSRDYRTRQVQMIGAGGSFFLPLPPIKYSPTTGRPIPKPKVKAMGRTLHGDAEI